MAFLFWPDLVGYTVSGMRRFTLFRYFFEFFPDDSSVTNGMSLCAKENLRRNNSTN